MGLPAPWLIALVLLCFVLAAIPTRRLVLAGIRPAWLWAYVLLLVGLGVVVVAARGPGRFLVPFLVVLYVAPLVVGAGHDGALAAARPAAAEERRVGSGPRRRARRPAHPVTGTAAIAEPRAPSAWHSPARTARREM